MTTQTDQIISTTGTRLSLRYTAPIHKPTFVWFCGFKSDICGSKVTELERWATENGFGFLAFDYTGHGQSEGAFTDGTISVWRADALSAIAARTDGDLILVGSSMGGWLALLCALELQARIAALVLIAPAPDFTDKLMWPDLSPQQQEQILLEGVTLRPSEYDDPYPITRDLIEDGKKWSLLDDIIPIDSPIHILQGMQDPDVPWQHALRLADKVASQSVTIELIKDGDHRLSRSEDIARLLRVCTSLTRAET